MLGDGHIEDSAGDLAMDHETAFIKAFVVPSKRERLIEFLRNPKRRSKVLATLYHF